MFVQKYNTEDTIAAIATAEGVSAIGIIRISGNDAINVCAKIFKGKDLNIQKSHTIHYGYITENEHILDEVMVTIFKAPKSFTTENSIEISCHGSPFILTQILQLLIKNGARLALPGEFSLRAFVKGRIDLSQAEAVGEIIASQNQAQLNIALQQMRGGLSHEIAFLRNQLLEFASLIELELDFGEEDVEFADRTQLNSLIDKIVNHINPMIQSFKYGNAIKNGIPVAIIGRPNAGKSSLLNLLLNEDRAIVSEIAGTTRDTIEEVLNINGMSYRFIDTAGIRETEDEIESIGIGKAIKKIEEAHAIFYIFDSKETEISEVFKDLAMIVEKNGDSKIIVLANKSDLISDEQKKLIKENLNFKKITQNISIQLSENSVLEINKLKLLLFEAIKQNNEQEGQTVITNLRHFQALLDAKTSLDTVVSGLQNQFTSDLLATDIKKAIYALGEISGEISNDEVLANIFGKFCIGK
ncbi:MAG: tRNA uridine-5-carboxymethylaminomethyl(34) synthesis GTPase MnmE [Bacteroidetes bacterium]|nr:tRNA uridine-5-carboxymethylaminomethyl(34) synthesis GTPase MnmE [Bacteroidota bacterium]